jgi:hypothetical protein
MSFEQILTKMKLQKSQLKSWPRPIYPDGIQPVKNSRRS